MFVVGLFFLVGPVFLEEIRDLSGFLELLAF